MLTNIFGRLEPSLKGKIKTYTEFLNAEPYITYSYDKEGFEIERVFYKNGQINEVFKLHSDTDSYYVTELSPLGNDTQTIFKFDKNRNLIYDRGRIIEYDEHQQPVKESLYYPNGNLEEVVNYKYVDSCKEMETIYYNTWSNIGVSTVSKYNKNGDIETRETDNNTTVFYKYDEKGNEIEIVEINNYDDSWPEEDIFEYDENGYLKFWANTDHNHGGGSLSYYNYELDNFNRIITKTAKDEHGELQEQQVYEYDEVGNIIKEIETRYYSEEKNTIKTFVIEYY